ncbi:ATP-binding cassette domain-containing protein [Paenibacillus sp. GCM10023252]|uniref:ATP-binding cassette domain-containing protein n=1 Tax=Paenibacillus sp. GCM10023252 TaxID=3252649 RepID=UPI00361FD969
MNRQHMHNLRWKKSIVDTNLVDTQEVHMHHADTQQVDTLHADTILVKEGESQLSRDHSQQKMVEGGSDVVAVSTFTRNLNPISIQGLSVHVNGDQKALLLQDINVEFQRGHLTLVIGHNGSGKSTLLESIAGLRALESGLIHIGDELLWKKSIRRTMRRTKLNRAALLQVGIALQHSESQWFTSTVRQELQYSLRPYKKGITEDDYAARVSESLQAVGLPEELLERDPWTLSGGQQRRLALACLLACRPQWLLLDEPTAGLDAEGISRLCAILAAHKAAGRGAVVVTHDAGALLPLADEVVVLSDGRIREAAPAAQWAAAHAHGATAPQALRTLALLRRAGLAAEPPGVAAGSDSGPGAGMWPAPQELTGAGMWPSPQELAAALAGAGLRPAPQRLAAEPPGVAAGSDSGRTSQRQSAVPPGAASRSEAPALAGSDNDVRQASSDSVSDAMPAPHYEPPRWLRYDPRAILLSYLIVAAGIVMQNSWWGAAVAAGVTGVILIPIRSLLYPWRAVIRGYLTFMLMIALVGGIGKGRAGQLLSFDWRGAADTLHNVGLLWLVMLIGLPMMNLLSPLRVQRALEQTFGWTARLRVPISSIALTVTLLFRFIPLLSGEWVRFSRIARARGKSTAALGSVPPSMLRMILIPYLRSILRLAEQMADALEARGFGRTDVKPTRGFVVRIGTRDIWLLAAAAILFSMLFLASKI